VTHATLWLRDLHLGDLGDPAQPDRNVCAAIINVTGVDPASPATLATGGVTITSTGTLKSTFTMQMAAAPTGNLCADLLLTVVDSSNVTNYAATTLTTEMGSVSLNDSAGASLWPGTSRDRRAATPTPSQSPRGPTSTPTPPTPARAAASRSSSPRSPASCSGWFQLVGSASGCGGRRPRPPADAHDLERLRTWRSSTSP